MTRPIFISLQEKVAKLKSDDFPKLNRKYDIAKLHDIYQHRGPNHFDVEVSLPLPLVGDIESVDGGASVMSSKSGVNTVSSKDLKSSVSQLLNAQKSTSAKPINASKSMSQKQLNASKSLKQSRSITPGNSTKAK